MKNKNRANKSGSAVTQGKRWAVGVATLGLMACGVDSGSDGSSKAAQQAVSEGASCEVIPPFTPNFEPELEWQWTGSTVLPTHNQVMMTPVVVDVNGDGIPDVIFNAFAGSNFTDDGRDARHQR